MFLVIVFLSVSLGALDSFLVATLEMAHASLREEGCRRFEVIRQEKNPTQFLLYAAYNDRAALEAHRSTDHLLEWQAKVTPLLAEPPRTETFTQLF